MAALLVDLDPVVAIAQVAFTRVAGLAVVMDLGDVGAGFAIVVGDRGGGLAGGVVDGHLFTFVEWRLGKDGGLRAWNRHVTGENVSHVVGTPFLIELSCSCPLASCGRDSPAGGCALGRRVPGAAFCPAEAGLLSGLGVSEPGITIGGEN